MIEGVYAVERRFILKESICTKIKVYPLGGSAFQELSEGLVQFCNEQPPKCRN